MHKYYAVLGLPSTASKEEVRRKYRQLALLWHPDKNPSPGAAAKFVQLTEAYDILMGERAAPRSTDTTYKRSTSTTYRPKPKTGADLRREKRMNHELLMRAKFENIRQQHLRARDAQRRREAYYTKATLYFIAAGCSVVLGIGLPLVVLGAVNLIWTLPVSFALGMSWLWTGGRIKMRADMIYSGRTDYTSEDIAEFFRTRAGLFHNSSTVGGE